jgi:hypothetical protein
MRVSLYAGCAATTSERYEQLSARSDLPQSAAVRGEGVELVVVAIVGEFAGQRIVAAAPVDGAVYDRRARPNRSAAGKGPLNLTSPGVHGVEIAAGGAGVNHAVSAGDKAVRNVLGTFRGGGLPDYLAGGGVERRP